LQGPRPGATLFDLERRGTASRTRPEAAMKSDIHPKYFDCQVICGCGNTFKTRATVKELRIEICSQCHPFYSGKQKFVDSAGRVDRFVKKYGVTGKK
jgi:large subunit ribosomal protein L31